MKRLSDKPMPFSLALMVMVVLLAPCTLVNARERPAIEAMMFHSISRDVVSLMLPVIFTGISSEGSGAISLSLVDTIYCGIEGRHGTAKLLGLLYPGEPPNHRIAPVLREEDCKGSPPTILKRSIANPGTPHWIGLVELDVKWTPWQVEFLPTKLHGLAKSQHPKVGVSLPHDATRVYQTAPIQIPAGHGKAVPLHVALGVDGKAFIVNGLVIDTPPAQYVPAFTGTVTEKVPSGTNVVVAIPHVVANTIFTTYLAGETYALQFLPMAPAMTAKNPVIAGSPDTYLTTSLLGLREHPEAFNAEVEWTGHDLRLARLSLTARHTACGSDVVCQVKRAGLDAVATSFTHLLSAQYKDIPLRSIILQDVLSVKLNEKEVRVRVEVLRAEATVTHLILYAKLTLNVP